MFYTRYARSFIRVIPYLLNLVFMLEAARTTLIALPRYLEMMDGLGTIFNLTLLWCVSMAFNCSSKIWSACFFLPFHVTIQNERFVPPADRHNITGQFNPDVHYFNGTTSVSLPSFPQSIDSKVLDAVDELGGIFSYNEDINSGSPLGLGECVPIRGIRQVKQHYRLAPEDRRYAKLPEQLRFIISCTKLRCKSKLGCSSKRSGSSCTTNR